MGSYRRSVACDFFCVIVYSTNSATPHHGSGKATCGDIDIMITRCPKDGRTHAGKASHTARPIQYNHAGGSIARNPSKVAIGVALGGYHHGRPFAVARCCRESRGVISWAVHPSYKVGPGQSTDDSTPDRCVFFYTITRHGNHIHESMTIFFTPRPRHTRDSLGVSRGCLTLFHRTSLSLLLCSIPPLKRIWS
jgi:hypothetical protein